jgi:cytochrome c peroxidase
MEGRVIRVSANIDYLENQLRMGVVTFWCSQKIQKPLIRGGITMTKKKCLGIILVTVLFFITGPALANNNLINLGASIYQDLNLSLNLNQSCMTCHHPSAGFADPENRISPAIFPVSDGSDPILFGGRNAPTASYAGFSPIFHYDGELFVGGLFWDGRATGRMDVTATGDLGAGPTGDPLADQAKGPFGNPVEMALTLENVGVSTEQAVIAIIQASDYADKFEKESGLSLDDPDNIQAAYNFASLAIAAFERSKRLNKFNSKFDKFVEEQGGDVSDFGVVEESGFRKYVGPPPNFKSKYYSYDEADGLAIFNADSYTQMKETPAGPNGGMCYLCHLTTNHEVAEDDPNIPLNGPEPGTYNPLLTDFTYDNLGIPVNPQIAMLINGGKPEPPQPLDNGLGAQTDQMDAAYAEYMEEPGLEYQFHESEEGKFKVSSLRNLSRTAPYGHNGFFATIYDIVHFYNTRDVPGAGWPASEVPETINTDELGNLGLTLAQEQKLVMFLETLND